MVDNDREDAANEVDDNEETDERPKPQVKKTPESSTSAPVPGDDIIIK